MGLETSIVDTEPNFNLKHFYLVLDALVDKFDWYLGDDKTKRAEKYEELKLLAGYITPSDVCERAASDPDLRKRLDDIAPSDFKTYIAAIVGSIQPHQDGNTHLFFNCDNIKGTKDITFTCSHVVTNLLDKCAVDGETYGDIVEIDINKVKKLAKKWNSKSFALSVAKWVGYVIPSVRWRILEDLWLELTNGEPCDLLDMLWYKDTFNKVVNKNDPKGRLWIVKSY